MDLITVGLLLREAERLPVTNVAEESPPTFQKHESLQGCNGENHVNGTETIPTSGKFPV